MDALRLQELQASAAMAVCESIEPTDWRKAVLNYAESGRDASIYMDLIFADDRTERVMKPPHLPTFREIRREMATPNHGTWFSAVLTVSRDGSYSYDFNYDTKPDWGYHEPSIDDYLMDLEMYPRPADEVPSWYPTLATFRAELVEQVAEIAEGVDWRKVTVRCVDPEEGKLEVTAELPDGELKLLEYDSNLMMGFSQLLQVMLTQGHPRWQIATVNRNGDFEFSD